MAIAYPVEMRAVLCMLFIHGKYTFRIIVARASASHSGALTKSTTSRTVNHMFQSLDPMPLFYVGRQERRTPCLFQFRGA
jgi:hypothetical protein